MSNSDGQIIIQVMLDDKDAKKGLDGIDKETGKLEKGASSKFGKIAGSIKTIGVVAAGVATGVGAVAVALGAIGAPLVQAAAQAQAMNAQFEQVFGQLQSQAQETVNSLGDAFGMLPDRIKPMFTKTTSQFKGLGLGAEEAMGKAEQATSIAANAAAFFDVSMESAGDSLNSFIKGNYEGGEAIGVFANETQMAAFAVSEGLVASTKEWANLDEATKQATRLDYAEKMLVAAGAIDEFGQKTGQASRESDSLENQLGNLKQAWENLKALLGAPLLEPVIAGLKLLTDLIQSFDTSFITTAFENLKSSVASNGEGIRAAAEQAFNGLKSIIESVLNLVVPFVQEQVEKIKQFWSENGEQILQAVTNAFNGIKAVIDFVMPAIKFVIDFIWTAIKNVITGALDVIMGVVKVFSGLLTGDWSKLWEGIKQTLSGAVNLILGIMSLTFVGGIRTALTNLAKTAINLVKGKWTSIVGFFKTGVSNAQTTVSGLVTKVISFFKNLATNASTTVTNLKTTIVNTFLKMKDDAVAKVQGLKDDVISKLKSIDLKQIGKDIIQGLINGIGSMKDFVLGVIEDTVGSAIDFAKSLLGIASPSKVFKQFGEWVSEGLGIGIENEASVATKAMETVTESLIEIGENYAKEAKERELKLADDLSDANEKTYQAVLKIQQKAAAEKRALTEWELAQIKKIEDDYRKDRVALEKKAAKDLEKIESNYQKDRLSAIQQYIDEQKSLELLTTAQEAEIWKQSIAEFKEGSAERIKAQQSYNKAAGRIDKERLESIEQFVADKKSLEQLSTAEEAEVWKQAITLFGEGTTERIKAQQNYNKAVKAVDKERLDQIEKYISEQKSLNKLSLKEEAAIWKDAVNLFEKGSDERIKAQENYNKAAENVEKERLSQVKDFINEKKEQNKLSARDEVLMWQQAITMFEKGSNERIEAQKAYKNALESLNKETVAISTKYQSEMQKIDTDLTANIKKANEDLEKSLADRRNALFTATSTFNEVKRNAEVTGEALKANLQGQYDAMKEWQEAMNSLGGRVNNMQLIEELRKMGPNAVDEIKALNSMSDAELDSYVQLYEDKFSLAYSIANTEMGQMREDTAYQIEQMTIEADKKLAELQNEWDKEIKALTQATGDELSNLKQIGVNAGQGLLDGLASMQSPLIDKAREIAQSISSTLSSAFDVSDSEIAAWMNADNLNPVQVSALNTGIKPSTSNVTNTTSSVSHDNSRTFAPIVSNHFHGDNPSPSEAARQQELSLRKLALEF